jgi:hypothetical protein
MLEEKRQEFPPMLGNAILGAVILTTAIWQLGLAPSAWLWQALEYLAIWGALSTLLVGCIGAWIALGRARQDVAAPRGDAVRRGSVAG